MQPTISSVKREFFSWADRVLSGDLPESTCAFHFNLYEGVDSVHVQLIGADSFTPGDVPETDYSPGAETFSTGEEIFEIPFSVAGVDWRQWLESSIALVQAYIASGRKASVLKSSKGVGIGFVDGDMHVLWQSSNA